MGQTPENTPEVKVYWEDIKFSDNWDPDDDSAITPVESYTGTCHLLEITPTYVRLGNSYDYQEERWGTIHTISLVPPSIIPVEVTVLSGKKLVDFWAQYGILVEEEEVDE